MIKGVHRTRSGSAIAHAIEARSWLVQQLVPEPRAFGGVLLGAGAWVLRVATAVDAVFVLKEPARICCGNTSVATRQ